MRISAARKGLGTLGLLGITLITLVATDFISMWWLILAVFFTLAGIGDELSDNDQEVI